MGAIEEKKERCRFILEKAMRDVIEVRTADGLAWFAWGAFQEDPLAAMGELEDCARELKELRSCQNDRV